MNPRTLWIFALLAMLCAQLALPAFAEDDDDVDEWTFTFATAFESDYIWRGFHAHDGISIQPEFLIEHESGVWLDVWGQVDTTDDNGAEWDFQEIDYTLGYDWNIREWDFSIGALHYTYPGLDEFDIESTTELFGEVTYNFDPFSPYVGVYVDVDEAEGYYLYGGFTHVFRERHQPTLNAWLGYGDEKHNEYYFGKHVDGAVDANVDLSMNFVLNENWSLVPHIAWTGLMDEDVSGDVPDDNFFHGGISALFTWD